MVTQRNPERDLLSYFASFTAVGAFLFGAVAILVVSLGDTPAKAVAAQAPVAVSLSEFAITPGTISAGTGHVVLTVTNRGTTAHNLQVKALGKATADIPAGQTATLDLGDVEAGTYKVICAIPGHEAAGMTASLVVTDGGGTAAATTGASDQAAGTDSMAGMDHGTTDVDYAAMDTTMSEGMARNLDTFVKGGATAGVGNQKLAPEVLPDGTKRFTLEAAITDWETAPGTTVKAWTYNGMVPGPWLRVEPGDKVEVVIRNSLPVSTDIHFHGITTPFEMDGVAPLTQPAIAPGETFTYSFTAADHAELGMYHAHDHGEKAVVYGMFAVFQVGDLPLPRGSNIDDMPVPADMAVDQEVAMVTNDAGVIGLTLNGKSYPATAPLVADAGDWVLVHYYNEGLQAHPMHLHHVPQLVVAKDGFALAQPYYADTINVAPGERYSVLVHPTSADIGTWAWHCHILSHAENDSGLYGMVTALVVNDPTKAS